MDDRFGARTPFSLGVEEELLLVDPGTRALTDGASALVPRTQPLSGEVKFDVYEALVETATPVVADAAAARDALAGLRARLRDAGATLLGAGIHPDGAFGDVRHVTGERYVPITESMRGLMRRTPTGALHVHVGMPTREAAIGALATLRDHLPLLQALAANSPFWHGVDSGFASARSMLFRGYPTGVIPPPFATWGEYEALVEEWCAIADLPDYTYLWWDLRPHPNHGTVEVRAMDAQASLGSAAGLAALVHGLAQAGAAAAGAGAAQAMAVGPLQHSSYRAGRDGLQATLWWHGALRPVPEIAADALATARAHLDDPAPLEEIERILRDGNGADRTRRAFAAGGMRRALEHLTEATAAG